MFETTMMMSFDLIDSAFLLSQPVSSEITSIYVVTGEATRSWCVPTYGICSTFLLPRSSVKISFVGVILVMSIQR